MLSDFRLSCRGVSSRLLGITILSAVLFVVGCSTKAGVAQFAVTTTSASLPAGSISTGAVYPSTTLTASNGTAPYTWAVTTGNLPPGLNLSTAGVISGTATTSGTFAFTVTATDSATPAHTATANLSITINAKLTITSAGTLTTVGAAGSAYSATISATGGVGPFTWAVNSGNLPTGLNLTGTSGTGTISGTISSSAAPGSYNFTAKITDSQGGAGISGTITITVDPALTITPPTLPTGVVGVNYTALAFTAAGGSGTGYSFTIASGALPGGLTLGAATGLISAGPPTTAGPFTFTVKVTDSLGFTATTGTLSITINPAITVTLSPTGPVTLDQGKPQPVTATVNNDPASAGVTWSAVTGGGSLSGSTTTATTYNAPGSVSAASAATFTATSKTDPTKSATFTVNLVQPPQITTTTMNAGNVNGAYSSPVSMTGGVAPYTWAIVAAPAGISLSSSTTSTVTVQGTPTVAGANQTFTIKVTDAQGLSVTSSGLTITVYPTLTITPPALPTGVATLSYSSPAFTAGGGSGAGYTFAVASGSIAPLTIGAATGIISGTPTTAGTLNFTVKVTDSVNNTATTGPLSITINPAITVTFSPTSPVTLDQGKSQLVTATANNDPNSAGVTWSAVTGGGSLGGSTTTATTYNAPGSVGAASTATFTATSITDPSKSATFTVNLVPQPQITTTTMNAGNVNGAYSSPVSVSGGVAPYTWAIVAAPTGITLNGSTTSTVTVQGTPTVSGANQTFTIKVTDAQGLSATSSGLTITVYPTLVLTPPSSPLPTGAVGVNYPTSETFTASGGSGTGYTWSIVAGNPLPTGLNLSSASGTSTSITAGPPTAAGTYPFAVKLMDSVGNTATTSGLSITINPPITVTLSPAQPFAMDEGTVQLITATVNNDPSSAGVTWSALTGNGGLSGSTSTTITYTAPNPILSSSIATFTATSMTDPTKSATFSISLELPPVIATPSFPTGTLNAAYGPSAVTVNGGVGPYTWVGTTLPPGLSLSSSTTSTVNVQGTPTSAGASQTVTIMVTDAKGLTNTLNSSITVNNSGGQISGQISLSNTCGSVTLPTFTVTINTSPTQQAQTDSSGNYSFASVPNGTYTITPSITGAASSLFYPVSYTGVVVNGSSVSGENFNAVVGYNVSGNVSYSGSQTGQTYVYLQNNNCGGGNGGPGTSLSSGNGAYTIHGVQPGTYTLYAWMDSTGVTSGTGYPGPQGQTNANNPTGSNSSVSVTNANVTGAGVTMSSPTYSTPNANPSIQVFPNAGGVTIFYNPPTVNNANGNKEEDANEYLVEWHKWTSTDGTDADGSICALGGGTGGGQFSTIDGSHTFYAIGAHGATVWILNNTVAGAGTFTSGAQYCFQARAFNTLASTTHPSGWGNYTDGLGNPAAVTITASAPSCTGTCTTVSGTVTIPAGVTIASGAPLYVGLFQQPPGSNGPTALYATEIANPAGGGVTNSYSITIPSGSNYNLFGVLDQNKDGVIDAGDVTDTNNNGNNSTLTVSGSTMTGVDTTLPGTNSTATVQTQYSGCGTGCSNYSLNLQVREANKLPVAVTLYSGPNLLNPVDMGQCSSCGSVQFDYSASLLGGTPNVNDTYNFTVTYSDGSVDQGSAGTINGKVTAFGSTGAVVGANDLPTNLSPNGTSSTSTTPNFTWTFPANPSNYTYSFYLSQNGCSGNCTIWQIPGQNSNSNGFTFAETTTGATTGQITWNTDPTLGGSLPSGPLINGDQYSWSISVQDSNGNQAQASVNYTP